jgi:hypothetical protein
VFSSVYSNIRVFLFQLDNWSLLFIAFAQLFAWLGSGHQRTEILMKTGAYHKLKMRKSTVINEEGDEDYTMDIIKSFFWKLTIYLYQIATVLCIVSTILFWSYWSSDIFHSHRYNYYSDKTNENVNEARVIFRDIITGLNNTVSPLCMIIDF